MVAGVTDPGHREEEGCFYTRGAKRNMCETQVVQVGISWTPLLRYNCE